MTEPSQYFKGRTVQEQMNEVIGYVDARAEEVAAAKADDVLEPAEQAKDDAIAAKEAAEDARDVTLAALPQIQQDITDLKAEDVALDRRLDNVELRIATAEGNIVTIQGRVTAIEGNYLKKSGDPQTVVSRIDVPTTATGVRDIQIANGTRIQNDLDAYPFMVRTVGTNTIKGTFVFDNFVSNVVKCSTIDNTATPETNQFVTNRVMRDMNDVEIMTQYYYKGTDGKTGLDTDVLNGESRVRLHIEINPDGGALLTFLTPKGNVTLADTRGN